MTHIAFARLAVLAGMTVATMAHAAETDPALRAPGQVQMGAESRTYYREHRLRAYEKTRAATSQGATCVTPKLVCWIGAPMSDGDTCSCETRRFGTVEGVVGG
ncbi:hypothetical protein [Microvirga antarctica]|uniref:hypothetical protein n=1 Tax=Microvirga antarctica TaxID=2819233 RepID=UPI001B300825|nr:hypothetical protein [Microvirga antarctica]